MLAVQSVFSSAPIFVVAVIAYDYLSRGRIHPATLWGGTMVAVFKPALFLLSGTTPWLAFAEALR